MVMPSFYREQKTAKVQLWKNVSGDHGKTLNLSVQGESAIYKEEIQYFNNMGFPVSTMNSTGVRVEYNSINTQDLPRGFLILFKYKVAPTAIERFKSFIFNVPKDTENVVIREMVKDFNAYYSRHKSRLTSYMESYNFDFIMYVESEELAGVDTVYIPECNMTLTTASYLNMSSNPTLAMRYNQRPLRVYANDEYREGFKFATTIQVVAPDHVPDNYFYYLGKQVCKTEAVRRAGAEEGIQIIRHEFDDTNHRFNVVTEFIPIAKAVENGFFRSKSDLLTNGDPEEIARRELLNGKLELERLKNSTEITKANAESVKIHVRKVELSTELLKANTENNRQTYENLRHDARVNLLNLETNLSREKNYGDLARERLGLFTEVASARLKIEHLSFTNDVDRDRIERKLDYDIESNNIALVMARDKAHLDSQSSTRKHVDEGIKIIQMAGSIVKSLI